MIWSSPFKILILIDWLISKKKSKFYCIVAELIIKWNLLASHWSNNELITKFLLLCTKHSMDKLYLMSQIFFRWLLVGRSDHRARMVPLLSSHGVTFSDQAFSAFAPRLRNRLPGHIKDTTFEQFKKLLKSHLFKDSRVPLNICLCICW